MVEQETQDLQQRIELEDFVKETLRQVEAGATGHGFAEAIQFKILVTRTRKIDGKIKVWVASGEGEASIQHTHEISFKIWPLMARRAQARTE